jgi:phosphonate transport system substrate-binding protein
MKKQILVSLIICLLFPVVSLADPFTIAIFPRRDAATTVNMFTPLANYLEEKLQRPVEIQTGANFQVFLNRLNKVKADLIHLNQYQYINIHNELGYEAIVQNEEFKEQNISSAIYVRKDSGITEVKQLKGKNIVFGGGKTAMMSYIVPTYLLRQAGLEAGDYKEVIAVNPPNAVLATYLNQADAGAAGEVVRRLPLVTKKINTDELMIIAESEKLPHLPWAINKSVPDNQKQFIKQLLVDLKLSKEGKAILKSARLTAFNPVDHETYNSHKRIIDSLNNNY